MPCWEDLSCWFEALHKNINNKDNNKKGKCQRLRILLQKPTCFKLKTKFFIISAMRFYNSSRRKMATFKIRSWNLYQLVRDICLKECTTGSHIPLLCSNEWAQSRVQVHAVKALPNTGLKMLRLGYVSLFPMHTHREKWKGLGKMICITFSRKYCKETNEDMAVKAKQLQSFRWGNRRVWII